MILLTLLGSILLVPKSKDPQASRLDPPGALLTLIGLLDATLINHNPLHAFIISMSIILLLSLGLSLIVQPLNKPLPPHV